MAADAKRLIELSMVPELAKEVASQMDTGTLQIGTTSTTAMAGNRVPTTTIRGGVLQGDAVADCVPAADGTSAGTQLNLLLAELRANGTIAAA